MNKALFPDTPYRFESGGYPEEIPTLTQEMFLDFHKTYYSPQNSFIYLYGNMDIDAYLSYLDEAYLSHFDKDPDFPSRFPCRPPLTGQRSDGLLSGSPGVDVDHKTYLSLNIVMGSSLDQKQTMALKVLTKVLFEGDNAPCALPSCGPVSAAMYQAASMPPSSSPFFLSALAAVRKVKRPFHQGPLQHAQELSRKGHPAGTYGSRTQQRRIQDARS